MRTPALPRERAAEPGVPDAATPAGVPARQAAVAGAVAAMLALVAAEVVVGLFPSAPSLVLSVGAEVIDRAPPALEDAAIEAFGTSDKLALLVGIVAVTVLLGAALGVAAARRFPVAVLGCGAFGVVGVAAAVSRRPEAAGPAMLTGLVAVVTGVAAFRRLLQVPAPPSRPVPAHAPRPAGSGPPDPARRGFFRLVAVAAGVALVAAAAGRRVGRLLHGGTDPREVVLPAADTPLAAPAGVTSLDVDGLSPLFTPNEDFYRIDTALVVPRVDVADWRLRVGGLVDRPFELTFDELLSLPQVEADVTLACVSNEVGGDLVGNARWRGVPLADLLDRAGVQPGATQVVGRSVDGWTGGFPTGIAMDGRSALVAVGMNGEALPLEHGFPARLVVPGLYGYVSATKWLTEIELRTLEDFDGYWVPRGWSKLGPVKTQSRIDVPDFGARVPAGRLPIAGVAWAPHRGVARVEVAVDDGPWVEAALAEELGDDTWRQWRTVWEARPGRHQIRVRATDGDGRVQPAERVSMRPDGATGHHTIQVTVAG